MDRWEGEDEEENVKDNWDDDDEAEPVKPTSEPSDPNAPKATQVKKKKKLADVIAQKEAAKNQQPLSPEEVEAARIRQQKSQEEAELKLIGSTFGVSNISITDPETKPDFDELRKQVVNGLTQFEKRTLYGDFLEDLIQDLAVQLPSRRLKKVKTTVETIYFEKSKQEKAKPTKTSKGKVKLNVEGDKAILKQSGVDDFDEYDDFM